MCSTSSISVGQVHCTMGLSPTQYNGPKPNELTIIYNNGENFESLVMKKAEEGLGNNSRRFEEGLMKVLEG